MSANSSNSHKLEEELDKETIKSRAIRSSFILIVRQFIVRVLNIIGLLVLARLLDPVTFGVFAILQFIVLFFEVIGALGFPTALIRQKGVVLDDQYRAVFTLQCLLLVISVLLIITCAPYVVGHYDLENDAIQAMYIMCFALFFSSFKVVPRIVLERAMRHDAVAFSEIVEYIAYLLIAMLLAVFGAGLWSLVIATVARALLGLIVLYIYAAWRPRLTLDLSSLKAMRGFALSTFTSRLLELANRALVPVLVGTLFGVYLVGIINFARTILDVLIAQPINMVGRVQFRVFSTQQDNNKSIVRNVERSYLLGGMITFFLAVMAALFSEPLVLLVLGEKWRAVVPAVEVMAFGYAFYAILNPSFQCLRALGDIWMPLVATAILFILTFGLTFILSPQFDDKSYPIATLISIPAVSAITAISIGVRTGFFGLIVISRLLLCAAITGACMYLIVPDELGVISSLLYASLGGLIYFLLLGILLGKKISLALDTLIDGSSALPRSLQKLMRAFSGALTRLSLAN